MNSLDHDGVAPLPNTLPLRQRFRQAKEKSRLARVAADWHRSAWDMPTRLHIWTDGQSVIAAVWSSKQGWKEGPRLSYDDTTTPRRILEAVREQLRTAKTGVGVIFHVADELYLVPVNDEELARLPGDLADVTMRDDPHQLVVERLPETDHAWRLIQTSKGHQAMRLPMLRLRILNEVLALRERYPVRCAASAAPLQMLAIAPLYYSHPEGVSPSALRVMVLYYPRFTMVAVINPDGQILALTNMPHGGKSHDPQFAQKLATLIASCSSDANETIFLVLVQAGSASIEGLHREVEEQANPNGVLPGDLIFGILTPESLREAIEKAVAPNGLPAAFAPEFLCNDLSTIERVYSANAEPRAVSPEALSALNKAAHANFFTPDEITGLSFPTAGEVAITSATKALWPLAWGCLIIVAGFGCWDAYNTMSSTAWTMPEVRAIEAQTRVDALRKLKKSYADWKRVLTPRSQAWSTMELIARLFPEDSGLTLDGVTVVSEPAVESKAGLPPDAQQQKAAIRRTYTLKGYTKASNVAAIEALTTAHVRKVFEETSKLAGAALLSPSLCAIDSRTETQRMTDNKFSFTLTITQTVDAKSDAALPLKAVAIPKDFSL